MITMKSKCMSAAESVSVESGDHLTWCIDIGDKETTFIALSIYETLNTVQQWYPLTVMIAIESWLWILWALEGTEWLFHRSIH